MNKKIFLSLMLTLPAALGAMAQIPAKGYTRVDLTAQNSDRSLFSVVLRDGEPLVLAWRNSLFDLDVTEGFRARQGKLIQYMVIFADPRGLRAPEVMAADVDDLYHTGGSFSAYGLNKVFSRVVYRVSESGNPKMRIRDHVVDFKQEVGFGGAIVLTAATPGWYEVLCFFLDDHGISRHPAE